MHYCSRDHQKHHWASHKPLCQSSLNGGGKVREGGETGGQERKTQSLLFPEMDICVEEEGEEEEEQKLEDRTGGEDGGRTTVWEDAGEWRLSCVCICNNVHSMCINMFML